MMNTRTKKRRPPIRRTAISLPGDVLEAVDEAARERGESRSGYIARILETAVRVRRDADITRRLDALFSDEAVRADQARTRVDLDRAGTDWGDERW